MWLAPGSWSISKGTGFHKTLHIDLKSKNSHSEVCIDFPRQVILDPYEIKSLVANGRLPQGFSSNYTNLEAPAWISEPTKACWTENISDWASLDIPFHMRYLEPSDTGHCVVRLSAPRLIGKYWERSFEPKHVDVSVPTGYNDLGIVDCVSAVVIVICSLAICMQLFSPKHKKKL